jgi:hypothetical protein
VTKKFHKEKLLTRKKLAYMNGYHGAFFDAEQLSTYLRITKAHAYRIIKDPSKLSRKHKQLLDVHAFGQLTGFEKGWVCKNGKISSPAAYPITQTDLENFIWLKSTGMLKTMIGDLAHQA